MHIKTMKVIQTAHSSNTKPLLGRESRTPTAVNAAVDVQRPELSFSAGENVK